MPAPFHFRLTHKIAAIGILSLAGLLSFGAIYQLSSSVQDASQERAEQARGISDLTQRVSTEMLEARRAEKDFLLRREDSYAKRHAELSAAIGVDFDRLRAAAKQGGALQLVDKLDAAAAGYARYDADFNAVAAAAVTLGLDENAGQSGALRTAVHQIEARLRDFDDPRLTSGMLLMRRHEKDFMLRRDVKYVAELKASVAAFGRVLEAAGLPPAAKADISADLDKYQTGFMRWAEAAQEMAKRTDAMSRTFRAIEPAILDLRQSVEALYQAAVDAEAQSRASARRWLMITFLVAAVVVGAFSAWIALSVSRSLSGMVAAMLALSEGNFDIVLPGLGRRDEIGEVAGAVEKFKIKAQDKARHEADMQRDQEHRLADQRRRDMHKLADDFEAAVGEIIDTVSSASRELEASATTLTGTAERSQERATAVASASEEATANVQSVASATEELSSSVNEISRQVQESAKIAGAAVVQAQNTNERVGELAHAASRIGDVVELIRTIAGQTNLLALNATIEAARAGEAGRGFAVVASEVKTLAEQTAKATSEISQNIAGIQSATDVSVAAIREIGGTIGRMSEIASTIAAAVEEQGAATEEISRNVQQAAQFTQQVSSNITDVRHGSTETGSASTQVLAAAKTLAGDSTRLKLEVGKFLDTIRAA